MKTMKTTTQMSRSTPEARFWDKVAPSYSKKPVADEKAYEQTLERVRVRLGGSERVLELGCGTGSTALKLAGSARSIEATDVSPVMIDIARKKAQAAGVDNVNFEVGTLDSARLAGRRFDVVMAFNLLHLLPDIHSSVVRIVELIEPGGWFIAKTPCVGDMGIWVRGAIPIMRMFGRAPFVNFVTRSDVESATVAAGLEIVETDFFPNKSECLYIVARARACSHD